jgi:hypothetical protein
MDERGRIPLNERRETNKDGLSQFSGGGGASDSVPSGGAFPGDEAERERTVDPV